MRTEVWAETAEWCTWSCAQSLSLSLSVGAHIEFEHNVKSFVLLGEVVSA